MDSERRVTNRAGGIETPRRTFMKQAGLSAATLATLACSPAAAPPPVAPATASGQPSGLPAWETTWNEWVAAAKKEGTLTLMTQTGGNYPEVVAAFSKTFPGVEVELKQYSSGSEYGPKVTQGRQAGIYAWDAAILSVQSPLLSLRPIGALDPLASVLIRPDVTDDKAWTGGFISGFSDTDKKLAFLFAEELRGRWLVNTDLVKPEELTTFQDLLAPRWKGKLLIGDVRTGSTYPGIHVLRKALGEDAVKKLLIEQQPVYTRDSRALAEDVIRGKYPISFNATIANLAAFRREGLAKNIKLVTFPETAYLGAAAASFIFNRAPHSNAARVWVN